MLSRTGIRKLVPEEKMYLLWELNLRENGKSKLCVVSEADKTVSMLCLENQEQSIIK